MENIKPDILEAIDCTGEIPPAIMDHTAIRINENLVVVFGGSTTGSPFDCVADTYWLDLPNRVWTALRPTGETPSARHSHAACS